MNISKANRHYVQYENGSLIETGLTTATMKLVFIQLIFWTFYI